MMSEKRFVVETVAVREKVITDKEKCYSYEDLDEIVDKLNEQQETIRKLQDLCGKSDYENAKLRIKNNDVLESFVAYLIENYTTVGFQRESVNQIWIKDFLKALDKGEWEL